MQLICEAYHFMSAALGMDNAAMQQTFADWNRGKLDSYLIEITADILDFKTPDGETHVVDTILDKAGQKGTGKWTGINALELGVPFAAKIVSYTQGYMLMRAAAEEYGWELRYGAIAQMWRGGCIIRSAFLDDIKAAFDKQADLASLLIDDYFRDQVHESQAQWRKLVSAAVMAGIPTPAMSSALAFYDGYRTARLPANLLQAQRDYFGAHTYQKLDGDGSWHHTDWIGSWHHTDWIGSGGGVSSSSYNA